VVFNYFVHLLNFSKKKRTASNYLKTIISTGSPIHTEYLCLQQYFSSQNDLLNLFQDHGTETVKNGKIVITQHLDQLINQLGNSLASDIVYCLLFIILRPFGTRESIR
jgi:hypothetical protein